MPKYLDPKNDVVFKKVFIEHKDLMISFLNSLLPLPDDCEIVDLQYLPAELLPDNPMLKDSFVDARCVDSKGRHFVVEMQMYWSKAFLRRMLFNTTKAYIRGLEIGDDYNELRPVYGLAILNDVMDKVHTHYYHRYRMTEETHPEEIIEGNRHNAHRTAAFRAA
jgi:predicted transposase/invertase (TIGR01784 family)